MGDDYQQKSLAFVHWLQRNESATISPKIEIADLRARGAGRGIVATEDIEENEELFAIPHPAVLSVKNSDLQNHLPNELDELDPWMSLVVVMIYESGQGDRSRWWPYWNVLPEKFDTLIYWSPSELAKLQGSAVLHKIGLDAANQTFIDSLLPIVQKHPKGFGEYAPLFEGPDAKVHLLRIAHRMASLVMAYAFDLEREVIEADADEDGFLSDDDENMPKGMVPLADMLNADGEDKTNARLEHGADMLTMVALKPIRKGEEIFNDHGPLPRSDLLRRYGYVTDNYKKYDVVELRSGTVVQLAAEHSQLQVAERDTRLEGLERHKVLEEGYDITRQPIDKYWFDEALLSLINGLTMDANSFKALIIANKPPKPQANRAVISVLGKAIRSRQNDYATSIAEDNVLLQDPEIQGRRRMAVEVRLGEKQILRAALASIDRRMASFTEDAMTRDEPPSKKAKTFQTSSGRKR
ncbi:SET domain [Lasallia pustulata]|uniref:Ribosomal lysine N-methyltransferase 4 n=1 Tax=Lasallia pustulata TaxID=136370 RepID=A0A1W5D7D9_9LECA|nr:SET domain [Lasallia pustulata]